jgi:hypothetical protein
MQFNPDKRSRATCRSTRAGLSVLLVREIQSQNLLNVVTNWSVHQVLGPWIKVRPSMVKTLQTMMVTPDDVIYTQDEFDENLKKQQELAKANPPPQDPAIQRSNPDCRQDARPDRGREDAVAERIRQNARLRSAIKDTQSLKVASCSRGRRRPALEGRYRPARQDRQQ